MAAGASRGTRPPDPSDLPDPPDLRAPRDHGASPRQLPVLDAVRLVRGAAKTALAVGLVVLVVSFEPHHLAVAFEREHVRRDAIEKPPVVADHDGTAREAQERFFE